MKPQENTDPQNRTGQNDPPTTEPKPRDRKKMNTVLIALLVIVAIVIILALIYGQGAFS